MNKNLLAFNNQYFMTSSDFDFFHGFDNHPINVEYHSHDFYEVFFFISVNVNMKVHKSSNMEM